MSVNKKLYKTEVCRNQFDGFGICPYEKKCRFAHTTSELRYRKKHLSYKTVICKKFEINGVCPYGQRCMFIHEDIVVEFNN